MKIIRIVNLAILGSIFIYLLNFPALEISPKDIIYPSIGLSGIYLLLYAFSVHGKNAKLASGLILIMLPFYILYLYKTFFFRDIIFDAYIYLAAIIYMTINIILSELLFPTELEKELTDSL